MQQKSPRQWVLGITRAEDGRNSQVGLMKFVQKEVLGGKIPESQAIHPTSFSHLGSTRKGHGGAIDSRRGFTAVKNTEATYAQGAQGKM